MNPYVKSVKPRDDHSLLLTFENDEQRIFDLKPYLNRGVFTRLKDQAAFKTARVVAGSVEWQGEIDLSYDTLYVESKPLGRAKIKRQAVPNRKKKLATVPAKRIRQPRANTGIK